MLSGVLVWLNVRRLHLDKMVRGVAAAPIAVFSTWGIWNLYYYPHLEQWVSFAAGVLLAVGNTTWVIQMIHYGRKGA